MGLLGNCCNCPRHTNSVGSHRDNLGFAILIKHSKSQCFGIFTTELENVSDLDRAINHNRGLTLWAWIPSFDFSGFDERLDLEISSVGNKARMLFKFIGASNPM